MSADNWAERAACRTDPPGLLTAEFFEDENFDRLKREYCEPCPVSGECLAQAILERDLEFGLRALTPKERRSYDRALRDRASS